MQVTICFVVSPKMKPDGYCKPLEKFKSTN